MPQLWTRS